MCGRTSLQLRPERVIHDDARGRSEHRADDREQRALASAVRTFEKGDAPRFEARIDRTERRCGAEQASDCTHLDVLNHGFGPLGDDSSRTGSSHPLRGPTDAACYSWMESPKPEVSSLNPAIVRQFCLTQAVVNAC